MPIREDEFVIANFMEPMPDRAGIHHIPKWWWYEVGPGEWRPRVLTFESIWLVEEKLEKSGRPHSSFGADHPFMMYMSMLIFEMAKIRDWEYCDNSPATPEGISSSTKQWGYHGNPHDFWPIVHATVEQKAKYLAEVISRGWRGKDDAKPGV
jgi:hypothetical protein